MGEFSHGEVFPWGYNFSHRIVLLCAAENLNLYYWVRNRRELNHYHALKNFISQKNFGRAKSSHGYFELCFISLSEAQN